MLGNVGPDEPFGGGTPGDDFDVADPGTTGQILQFRVVPAVGADDSTPPQYLQLPAITPLPATTATRPLALIEEADEGADENEEEIEGPVAALLGTVDDGVWTAREWMHPVTENPAAGTTEIWEIYNTTADAHPMHIHEIAFEVVNREGLVTDEEAEVAPADPARRHHHPSGAVGNGLQGHRHRVPRTGHSHQGPVQNTRPVRVALPHRRTRRQRNDAPLPHRTRATRAARVIAGSFAKRSAGTPPRLLSHEEGIRLDLRRRRKTRLLRHFLTVSVTVTVTSFVTVTGLVTVTT